MKSFVQLQQETHAVQLDFLLTDIGAANTFLDVAVTTRDPVSHARNVGHATEAYDLVLRMSERAHLSLEEAEDVRNRLALLKARLNAMAVPGA